MDQPQQTTPNETPKCSNIPANPNSQSSKVPSWNDDLFSIRTIGECEEIFEEYCENRIDQFLDRERLSILRSCLDLLNRLEGTTHRRFAGRVLIFLARVIPLYDQSGVNLRSDFCAYELPDLVKKNLEYYYTQRKHNDVQRIGDGGSCKPEVIEIEEGETLSDDEDSDDSTRPQTDNMKLYDRFWRLENLLHQPNQLYDKGTWISFRSLVDSLVLHFEHKPATCKVWKLKNSYMTEPKSFALQLDDVNLRRSFLVQILIALQYLDLPVETRPDTLVLDKNQASWMETITARIFSILASTPDKEEGREFCGLVSQVLKSEELWNQWKNEKCKEPKLPEENPDEMLNMGITYYKRRKMSDELKCAKPYNLHVIGSHEMSRLWNRRPHQPNAPDLIKYFTAPPDKQLECFKNPNTSFRILRLLRRSPYFFQPTKESIKSLDEYLRSLSDKHFNTQPNQPALSTQQQQQTQSSNQAIPIQQSAIPKTTTTSAAQTPTNSNSNESSPNTNETSCRDAPLNITTPSIKTGTENSFDTMHSTSGNVNSINGDSNSK